MTPLDEAQVKAWKTERASADQSPDQVGLRTFPFESVKQVPWMMRWLFYAWASGADHGLRSPCFGPRLLMVMMLITSYSDDQVSWVCRPFGWHGIERERETERSRGHEA